MTITEVLQFADRLVFTQTGKHLDDIQETVIKGVWQGKTYSVMADECNHSESRVRDVGYKLWQILSEQLGEDVNKSNFCATIERLKNSYSPNASQVVCIGNNNSFNVCPLKRKNDSSSNKGDEIDLTKKSQYDLTLAPKITHFYDRTPQLQTLSHWITTQNPRLISVLGLSGIGKTTLVKQFIDSNLQQFDLIIWKSIKLSPSLDNIITDIFTLINYEPIQTENKLTQLFNLFRQQRCLIILDDVQELFTSGQFAGQYKTETKNYKTFLSKITELEHQSTVILISQEQCQEMTCLDEELYPVKCLELPGLVDTEILKALGLKDEESWSKLIELYEGNPAYLKDIANLIKNIFFGKADEFVRQETLHLTEDMKFRLSELWERLTPVEQQILLELSKFNQPTSREELRQSLSLSSTDFINGLQSLNKRYLLKPIEGEKTAFNLSPVFREYMRYLSPKLIVV
ncbi:NB-ARC domain-containing protein [Aerosakkonemataceae cyanobacterium BLCC-F167]|uniref:NB-ARC domain-containing protein n=2 Tax=Floridanema TaxID=3396149 RepID=A0ABV4WDI1_9CYAN